MHEESMLLTKTQPSQNMVVVQLPAATTITSSTTPLSSSLSANAAVTTPISFLQHQNSHQIQLQLSPSPQHHHNNQNVVLHHHVAMQHQPQPPPQQHSTLSSNHHHHNNHHHHHHSASPSSTSSDELPPIIRFINTAATKNVTAAASSSTLETSINNIVISNNKPITINSTNVIVTQAMLQQLQQHHQSNSSDENTGSPILISDDNPQQQQQHYNNGLSDSINTTTSTLSPTSSGGGAATTTITTVLVGSNASPGLGNVGAATTAELSMHSGDSGDIDIKDGSFDDGCSDGYPDITGISSQQGAYISMLPPITGNGNSGGGNGNGIGGSSGNCNNGALGGGDGSTTGGACDQTELKYVIEELCPVCGDKVSGYHYGLLTCESCKGFFKRTVQNKKVYTCVAERSCHIDKTQRKRCPYCRFQKCLDVGMKLEAVRADRMRGGRNKFGPMYKRDRARKLQMMRQRQLALQAIRASEGINPSQLSPAEYQQQPYTNMNIKQEIQIPQVSSLTSSPDSSPSPIAIALGQVNPIVTTALTIGSGSGGGGGGCGIGGGGGGGGNNIGGHQSHSSSSTTTTTVSVPHTVTDSKLWFANSTTASPHSLSPKAFSYDTGTSATSTADASTVETLSVNFPRVSPMIREFVQSVDDREWQSQLYSLLQSQSYNQCEVDLFELMCKVLDQNLFSQVDWARNTIFFKDLKVDDQMKLLQNSWSDMLVLDHLHQRIHNNLPDETTLPNGQKFDLLGLGLLGVPLLAPHFNELQNKLQELKFDVGDYICMKFLLLLNPDFSDVRCITNRKTVLEGYESVQAALLDYTLTCYTSVSDKFSKLVSIIPEIHAMAARGEEHLYMKHCAGSAPTQTLLMEMLHAKRK